MLPSMKSYFGWQATVVCLAATRKLLRSHQLSVDEKRIVRIGAMDYEPLELVKGLTLDFKLERRIEQEQNRMAE
jgi:hypothetical protein